MKTKFTVLMFFISFLTGIYSSFINICFKLIAETVSSTSTNDHSTKYVVLASYFVIVIVFIYYNFFFVNELFHLFGTLQGFPVFQSINLILNYLTAGLILQEF